MIRTHTGAPHDYGWIPIYKTSTKVWKLLSKTFEKPKFSLLTLRWLCKAEALQRTYWICAFCVNQHSSICCPTFDLVDSYSKEVVPACSCDCHKYLNTDPPCREDVEEPMSINCEMNKFF